MAPTPDTSVDTLHSFVGSVGIYVVLFVTMEFVVRKLQKEAPKASDQSFYARAVRVFVHGSSPDEPPSGSGSAPAGGGGTQSSKMWNGVVLAGCAMGLQTAYLSWGILQERLITVDYSGERFASSQFLVFCNRATALVVAIIITTVKKQPSNSAPFYKYSYTSLSNIMSSWCQYEALKYVNFPTQVVSKSSKLIPVMLMGRAMSNKKYPQYDYAMAVVISMGVVIFTLGQNSEKLEGDTKTTSISGILLLGGYLCFDSFTSQYQGLLYSRHKMTPYQMMLGVNSFSAFFTFVSLVLNNELFPSLFFLGRHSECLVHVALLSMAGATGQMFIFYTIKRFGPLVFTIIMTVRQLTSIILSCLIYSHPVSPTSLGGACIVFAALGYRIKRKCDAKKAKSGGPAYQQLAATAGKEGDAAQSDQDVEAQLKALKAEFTAKK